MELNASFWMIIVGVLLIVAVLLDGYRRMRSAQSDNLRIKVKKEKAVELDDDFNPELPSGHARVVGGGSERPLEELDPLFDTIPEKGMAEGDGYAQPTAEDEGEEAPRPARKPAIPKYEQHLDDIVLRDSPLLHEPELPKRKPITASRDDELASEEVAYVRNQETRAAESEQLKAAAKQAESKASTKSSQSNSNQGKGSAPQEIVVLHVMAGSDAGFGGRDLLQVLLACDVRFGSMNIFHRYEQEGGEGQPQFSVVNSVNPGTFDLDDIENFSTPGISFFMQLPGPSDPMVAYDCMVETARALVKNLGGSLQDETHSVATNQTLQHYRQRIRDFTRKQMTLV